MFSIVGFYNQTSKYINDYESEELFKIKKDLEDHVNIAYNMISNSYANSRRSAIERLYGIKFSEDGNENIKMFTVNALRITIDNIRAIRFKKEGYIWINDVNPPYKVILHPIKPEMEQQSHVINLKETDQNIYEAFADICNESGSGFLRYNFYKEGLLVKVPKISYIKLFEPLGWVIGSGAYIDNIENAVKQKRKILRDQVFGMILFTFIISAALIVLASVILFRYGHNISNSISIIEKHLVFLSRGETVSKITRKRKDEIGKMYLSLNDVIDGFSSYTEFTKQIRNGKLDAAFKTLSLNDELGNSLLLMRKSLQDAKKEENQRKIDNEKTIWTNTGQAMIEDILRRQREDINMLSHDIINSLVKYINANQGGIFLYNDDDPDDIYLYQSAIFAYNRNRFHKKRIELGDGIIGACALEKKTIYMTNIPNNYIEITSGLGTANPKSLLIVPLKLEDSIYGIIEIASFETLKDYEIHFIEKISESISATFLSIKANNQTQKLLKQFREQADEKEKREKEMQESIEELKMLKEQFNIK